LESCGATIQNGLAISKLQKMFVIFTIQIVYCAQETPSKWLDMSKLVDVKDEKAQIFNTMKFPTFSIVIHFNIQESIKEAEKKMDELTLGIEREYPVA
jgi:hypothetical protein